MKQVLHKHIQILFDQVTNHANSMSEPDYKKATCNCSKLTQGELLLNLVCERERLLYQIKNTNSREWSCSIDDDTNKLQIMQALFHSSADLLVWLDKHEPTESEYQILLQVIEAEAGYLGKL